MIRLSSLSRRIGGGLADFSSPFKRPSVRVLDHLLRITSAETRCVDASFPSHVHPEPHRLEAWHESRAEQRTGRAEGIADRRIEIIVEQ